MALFKRKNNKLKAKELDQFGVDFFSAVNNQEFNNVPVTKEQEATQIVLEELPLDYTVDYTTLYEIKDSSIISRLNGAFQGGSNLILQNVREGSIRKAIDSAPLLKSDISVDQLTKARGVKNGLRATVLGKKGIEKNAVLTKVDSSTVMKSGRVAAGVSKVMNVSSLVVGQYYMNEVNTKLLDINKSINVIGNYQQREFKSRIMALINNVQEISNFSSEILENNDLRLREMHQLNTYKNSAVQLIEQVNITIQEITGEQIAKIQDYESKIHRFDKLLGYQEVLISLLQEISKLTYTLNLGEVSTDKCFSSFNNMLNHSNEARNLIPEWHRRNVDKLHIEVDYNRYKKQGLEGFIYKPFSLFDKKWDYKDLKANINNKIISHSQPLEFENNLTVDIFDDVQLIIKDGRYFYLPSSKEKR